MSEVNYQFSAMPTQLYEDGIVRNLSGNELAIYLFLVMRSRNYQREAYTTNQIIEDYTGVSRKTVGEGLRYLEKLGLIWKTQQGIANKRESHYSLLSPSDFSNIQIVQTHRCKKTASTIAEAYRLKYENDDDFLPLNITDITASLIDLMSQYGLAKVERMNNPKAVSDAFNCANASLKLLMHSDLHHCLTLLHEKHFSKASELTDVWDS